MIGNVFNASHGNNKKPIQVGGEQLGNSELVLYTGLTGMKISGSMSTGHA